MLYLGIDQHRKQLTVSIRNEAGDVVLRRQISTEWDRVRAFFDELRRNAEAEDGVAWEFRGKGVPGTGSSGDGVPGTSSGGRVPGTQYLIHVFFAVGLRGFGFGPGF